MGTDCCSITMVLLAIMSALVVTRRGAQEGPLADQRLSGRSGRQQGGQARPPPHAKLFCVKRVRHTDAVGASWSFGSSASFDHFAAPRTDGRPLDGSQALALCLGA
jgi:hypothetical protein